MLETLLPSLAHGLAARVSGRRLSVLIFHRVLPDPDPLFPHEMHAARFDRLVAFLKGRWNVVPLGQAYRQLRAGTLPSGSVTITFDDGYSDNASVALPILRARGAAATFFVATGFLDGGRMWNDTVIESIRRARGSALDLHDLGLGHYTLAGVESRRTAIDTLLGKLKYRAMEERKRLVSLIAERVGAVLPDSLMMTSEQLRRLRDSGMEVGAHTVNHPILSRLPAEEARHEITASKARLEAILGQQVSLFAYPNGKPGQDYLPEHAEFVRQAGFDIAVSTAWGACDRNTDPYQLPRFTPWHEQHTAFALALARNLLRRGVLQKAEAWA